MADQVRVVDEQRRGGNVQLYVLALVALAEELQAKPEKRPRPVVGRRVVPRG